MDRIDDKVDDQASGSVYYQSQSKIWDLVDIQVGTQIFGLVYIQVIDQVKKQMAKR